MILYCGRFSPVLAQQATEEGSGGISNMHSIIVVFAYLLETFMSPVIAQIYHSQYETGTLWRSRVNDEKKCVITEKFLTSSQNELKHFKNELPISCTLSGNTI